MNPRILGTILCASIIFGNLSFAYGDMINIQSPLKQIKLGIQVYDVKCKSGYSLIIRSSNDNPACVKLSHLSRFLSRGWIIPHHSSSPSQLASENVENATVHENIANLANNASNSTKTTPVHTHQNENTANSSDDKTPYPIYYYPVSQAQLVRTINASDLPPITEIAPLPAASTAPLPTINEPLIVNYSNPNVAKILAVGMSPSSLSVGDIPRFTVTYQNISDKPIYGIAGCGGNPDLQYIITPVDKVEKFYYSSCERADFGDIIQSNQIITEVPDSVYAYNIIQSGLLHITLTLDLSDNSTYYSHNIDIIQFNVNATQ